MAVIPLRFKRGTAAALTSNNPTLNSGEPGYETDTGKLKIGDGVTAWNSLSYFSDGEGYDSDDFDVDFATKSTTDLTEGTNLYYTDARVEAVISTLAGISDGIASLGSDGKIPSAQLPAISITDIYTAENETAQLALTVQVGDICIRTDETKTYIALNDTNGSMSDWTLVQTPTDGVTSVNGDAGPIVVLTTSDITEGTNLYYTEDRVNANTHVSEAYAAKHTHANSSILANITEAFTTALKGKLDGIESGATADQNSTEVPHDGGTKIPGATTVYAALNWLADAITNGLAGKADTDHNHDADYLGITATATKATKLETARTITINGDASGSTSFDGSANVAITLDIDEIDGGLIT